jgi:hypothetical protein
MHKSENLWVMEISICCKALRTKRNAANSVAYQHFCRPSLEDDLDHIDSSFQGRHFVTRSYLVSGRESVRSKTPLG